MNVEGLRLSLRDSDAEQGGCGGGALAAAVETTADLSGWINSIDRYGVHLTLKMLRSSGGGGSAFVRTSRPALARKKGAIFGGSSLPFPHLRLREPSHHLANHLITGGSDVDSDVDALLGLLQTGDGLANGLHAAHRDLEVSHEGAEGQARPDAGDLVGAGKGHAYVEAELLARVGAAL